MKKLAIKLITFYQTKISVNTPPTCKYVPTCSSYGLQCYQNYNFFKASLLTLWRILRCNPFSKGGYDPIPKIKKTLTKEQIDGYFDIDFEEDNIEKEESYSDSSSLK
ncbi:MAG: membrane protein insertion efficiency factor YidD [bacterium]